jgi:RNA polymerase sigma factor (sigma-70 family)
MKFRRSMGGESRAIVKLPTMSQAPQADDARQSGDSLDAWFKREILAHEDVLVRYLSRMWPNRHDIVDLRQDTYVRVYEAAAKARPTAPKSFLFATARHLMTDRFRRQRIVAIDAVGDLESLNVLIEDVSPERQMSAHQELRRLAEAIDLLPLRCREAVWMRRVDDLPQKEVAARLGVTEKVIEKHVMKGMRLLADALARSREPAGSGRKARHDSETDHGKP